MSLKGKKALVTGGSRGIGFQICKILLENGCAVLAVSKNPETLRRALSNLPDLLVLKADVGLVHDHENIGEYISTKWGSLDFLVNNAGISPKQGNNLTEQPNELFSEIIKVNLTGPYLAIKQLLPDLLRSEDPRIINIGSSMGVISPTLKGIYSVSKAALHALTIAFANELKGRIAVNALCPGWVRTDMAPDAPGDPRSSAEAVLWLLQEDRAFSGHILQGKTVIQ